LQQTVTLATALLLKINSGGKNIPVYQISAHSIYNFLFYNNLQQILIVFAAFTAFFSILLFFLLEFISRTITEAPKIQNRKFQLKIILILPISGNNRSFSKLLQTFLLLQMHEIWYGGQQDTNNVSAHSIGNFWFYNNLQQILVLFAAFCSKPLVWHRRASKKSTEEVKIYLYTKFRILLRK